MSGVDGARRREPLAIAIITGNQRRHGWFVNQFATDERYDLRATVREAKRPRPRGASRHDDDLIAAHLRERDEAEERYFGADPAASESPSAVLEVEHGTSNDPEVATWLSSHEPDFVLLFGCSIIREPILTAYARRVVNIHLGLSPYYRGAATNFWPVVNAEPECIGATMHLATPEVDGGPILRQARPPMEPGDGIHDLGSRALIAGQAAMADAVAELRDNRLEPAPQEPGGRLYRNKDFNADAVRIARERLASGMIGEYVSAREERDAGFPIRD